jgi:signal transduction histidine kinase
MEKGNQERIEKGWDVIKLMVGRLKNLVLNLLYYAKERDLSWERTDALSLANDVASTVEPKIKGYSIEFIHDFDRSIGKFEVDTSVVSSALINILENAMDACIEDKSKKSHKIIFSVTQDKDHIVFDIRDNGMGMDRETRENIFTLFFSSKGSKGTGLGLFVSNKIIQQHGGSIRVDSTPGQGSHFNIRLPKVLSDILKSKVNKKAQSLTIE